MKICCFIKHVTTEGWSTVVRSTTCAVHSLWFCEVLCHHECPLEIWNLQEMCEVSSLMLCVVHKIIPFTQQLVILCIWLQIMANRFDFRWRSLQQPYIIWPCIVWVMASEQVIYELYLARWLDQLYALHKRILMTRPLPIGILEHGRLNSLRKNLSLQ